MLLQAPKAASLNLGAVACHGPTLHKGLDKLQVCRSLSGLAQGLRAHVHPRRTSEGPEPALPQDLMFGETDAVAVLRLLCLLSAVQGGLPRKQADSLRRALLHAHGHPLLLVLSRLSRAGVASHAGAWRWLFCLACVIGSLLPWGQRACCGHFLFTVPQGGCGSACLGLM